MARKKTRKEKLISSKKRTLAAPEPVTEQSNTMKLSFDDTVLDGTGATAKKPAKVQVPHESLFEYDTTYFYSDLRKTIILTVLVVVAEFGLYLVMR
jgi:hypothetical protein